MSSNRDLHAGGALGERLPLTPRQQAVLRTVIEQHLSSGAPVGSKHVAGSAGLEFAPSTIRYELARLEELGFLDHPHTSAGRVPTDSGYRYYVDNILEEPGSSTAVVPSLADALEAQQMRRELDATLSQLAEVVSEATNLLGVVTAPAPGSATVRHVEVLQLQPQLVMVVVITSTGDVTRRVFALEGPVDPGLCEWAGAFLNERSEGMSVGARMITSRLEDPTLTPTELWFIHLLGQALTDLDEGSEPALYVGGQGRLLAETDRSVEAVEALLWALEARYPLLATLRGSLSYNEVYLMIGSELPAPELERLAIVAANYGIARRNLGTVSVMGPMRMDYRLAMSTVREAASALSELVGEVYE